jgi:hypothetical protein
VVRRRPRRADLRRRSEVHRMVIARECLKLAMQGESTRQAAGDL